MSLLGYILTDIYYKNNKGEYDLGKNNEFKKNDLDRIMDNLQEQLEDLMDVLSKVKTFLSQYDMDIDYSALAQALQKYTRDVFGPRRLKAVLKKVTDFEKIRGSMRRFGLKMNSDDPNIHRRVAYFFYWFGVYKPFHLVKAEDGQDMVIPEKDKFLTEYSNEYITYCLIQMILSSVTIPNCTQAECKNKKAGLAKDDCFLTINLHQNQDTFETFLSRLHSNKLNRSSLELLLSNSYIFSRCKKTDGPCLLHKQGFNRWRTFE